MKGIKAGANIADRKKTTFRSDLSTLKLDIQAQPPHFDFHKHTFVSDIAPPPVASTNVVEIYRVHHNLGYKPAHMVWFYSYNFTGSIVVPGSYMPNAMDLTGATLVTQGLSYVIDAYDLIFYYTVTVSLDGSPNTYSMAGASFGFKYFIESNKILDS